MARAERCMPRDISPGFWQRMGHVFKIHAQIERQKSEGQGNEGHEGHEGKEKHSYEGHQGQGYEEVSALPVFVTLHFDLALTLCCGFTKLFVVMSVTPTPTPKYKPPKKKQM